MQYKFILLYWIFIKVGVEKRRDAEKYRVLLAGGYLVMKKRIKIMLVGLLVISNLTTPINIQAKCIKKIIKLNKTEITLYI